MATYLRNTPIRHHPAPALRSCSGTCQSSNFLFTDLAVRRQAFGYQREAFPMPRTAHIGPIVLITRVRIPRPVSCLVRKRADDAGPEGSSVIDTPGKALPLAVLGVVHKGETCTEYLDLSCCSSNVFPGRRDLMVIIQPCTVLYF